MFLQLSSFLPPGPRIERHANGISVFGWVLRLRGFSLALVRWRFVPVLDHNFISNSSGNHIDITIQLYINQGGSPTQILARVCTTSNGVNIEMTSQGIQYGLVEASVLCASIFLSGHNIE